MANTTPTDNRLFTFNHVLLAESTNHSRHPRATLHDLRAILHSANIATDGKSDDHVAHWWEAQLIHYGLRPSKTKAVAKVRLLEALNNGNLKVPQQIVKLEAELKKEFAKKEREERKTMMTATTTTKPAKRKAADDGVTVAAKKAKPSATTTKKSSTTKIATITKTETAKSTATKSYTSKAAPTPKTPKVAATNSKSSKESTKTPQNAAPATTNHPRTKQTARRSGGFLAPGRAQLLPTTTNRPRTKQTARRSGGFAHIGRPMITKREYSDDDEDNERSSDSDTSVQNVSAPSPSQPQPLGLLNGRYEIDCPSLEEWGSSDFSLILTLEGQSLWGSYDFGMFEGIIHVPTRPYNASDQRFEFSWRGHDNGEGETSFGSENVGWLEFLGGGNIRGMINCYGRPIFEGRRVSGNQTRSERDARSMRDEWDGYNQQNYDRANRARWGGSGW